jgi:hypothetical protein
MPKSVADIAAQSQERAAASPKSSGSAAPAWPVLFGPVECEGGRGDALITSQPSTGVEHVEYRPRGNGRIKRAPLVAVLALGFTPPAPKRGGKK